MDDTLAQKAIDLALTGNWEEALKVNQEILKKNPKDLEALNRLARALAELGDIKKARKTAEEVLKIDPINTIAVKCLEKWKKITRTKKETDITADVNDFLEEPGKTAIIQLINPGDANLFANLDPGEEVKLSPSAHRVSCTTNDGHYIGRLPDNLATRLNKLMREGNKYRVLIKSIHGKSVEVFIREVERGKNVANVNSFPPKKIDYVAFTPPEFVHSDFPSTGEGSDESEAETS